MIIDAHCHVIVPEMTARSVPEAWRPALRTEDGQRIVGFRGRELTSAVGEFSDVEIMLGDAAGTGIGHLLLSPWINLVPVDAEPDEARLVCRVQNESLARLVAAHPGRLSAVGAVAVQDPALAARELADLMKVPGLHGVEIPSSVGGRYLGDDFFLPFWAAAAETGALVFIHPSTRGFGIPALDGYYLWNSVGNPLETAVTAAHIAVAGVLERFPQLRILLAHGGGALPVLRGRLRRAHAIRPEAAERLSQGPDVSLRRFHYDTVTHDAGPAGRPGPVRRPGAGPARLGPALRHGDRPSRRRGARAAPRPRRGPDPGRERRAPAGARRWLNPAAPGRP